MSQTASDYIRSHGLARKYGSGLAILALAGVASTLNGDPASLITLKMMIAIPFAIVVVWLPGIFDPVRSRLPFTPSFIERGLLEGLLIALGVTLASWNPDFSPMRMIAPVIISTMLYFGIKSVAYSLMARKPRQ